MAPLWNIVVMFKENMECAVRFRAAGDKESGMARFVTFEMAGGANNKIWVNAELITSVRPGEGCTIIHFDKDHYLAVNEPMDRAMLQISTGPIVS
jgi:hypothetical protein